MSQSSIFRITSLFVRRSNRVRTVVCAVCVIGAVAFTVLNTCGCSPTYVMRAAYEQSKILLAREDITEALAREDLSPEYRQKLAIVLSAREFAQSIGLDPGGSFTKYADIGKETLAWVVVAARKDSFALHTWWFPIVGRVPYKGYFDLKDAQVEAKSLSEDGYEAFVRGTDAFSTLGWFNDPVLSTTLQGPRYRVANTVIHESVHSTVWIKGNVPFNESFANFVGNEGVIQFFRDRFNNCTAPPLSAPSSGCAGMSQADRQNDIAMAERDRSYQLELAHLVDRLYADLDALYARTDISSEQKIAQREEVFANVMAPFRARYPELKALQRINNAEIIQLKLYLSNLDLFEQMFTKAQRKWDDFIASIREIAAAIEEDSKVDPFGALREKLRG